MIIVVTLIAGGLGAVVRHLVTRVVRVPWGVLAVNAAASLVAGAVLGTADAATIDPAIVHVLTAGFAGGLSTFSTLAVETVQLVREGRAWLALTSTAANLVLGTLAAVVGFTGVSAVFAALG